MPKALEIAAVLYGAITLFVLAASSKAMRGARSLRDEYRHASSSIGCRNRLRVSLERDDFIFDLLEFRPAYRRRRDVAGNQVDLGFDRIELGHGIRISLMPGIQKMFEAGEVKFSSLHNFCPLPVEVHAARRPIAINFRRLMARNASAR